MTLWFERQKKLGMEECWECFNVFNWTLRRTCDKFTWFVTCSWSASRSMCVVSWDCFVFRSIFHANLILNPLEQRADFIIYSLSRLNSRANEAKFDFSTSSWHKWELTVVHSTPHCIHKMVKKLAVTRNRRLSRSFESSSYCERLSDELWWFFLLFSSFLQNFNFVLLALHR